MTDEELIQALRNSKGWPTLGNAAADRIEKLIDANWCLKAVIREQEYEIMEMKK